MSEKHNEPEIIRDLFCQLDKQERTPFPQQGCKLNVPDSQGVYVIRSSDDTVAHVGRTVRGLKGLFQRLSNHLRGQSSFVRKHFGGDGNILRNGYTFQYLFVPDDRQRALLEHYAIGWYCPKHLGIGSIAKE